MRIASDSDHRVLAYIDAVERQGQILAPGAVDAYAETPFGPAGLTLGRAFAALASFQLSVSQRFLHLGWLKLDRRTWVRLTPLGSAVLRELDAQEGVVDAPVAVVVKPDDPMAYARVIEHIARYDEVLLVDPYLDIDSFALLLGHTSVNRVLTSRKGTHGKARIASLVAALSSTTVESPPQIRVGEDLHDRYVIPATGPIEHLGTSLNGVGKHISVMTVLHDPVAAEVRALMGQAWTDAKPLEPVHAATLEPLTTLASTTRVVTSSAVAPAAMPEATTRPPRKRGRTSLVSPRPSGRSTRDGAPPIT
jgi:hypothetical protein